MTPKKFTTKLAKALAKLGLNEKEIEAVRAVREAPPKPAAYEPTPVMRSKVETLSGIGLTNHEVAIACDISE